MLRYLLDTNIVIYVLKRRPVEVLSTFNANASRMAISSITFAELLHGAEKSSRVSDNLAAIEDFCSRLAHASSVTCAKRAWLAVKTVWHG
jgi:tRNA(fMet)-specific endonuclease VapC